jgi:cytochrome c5
MKRIDPKVTCIVGNLFGKVSITSQKAPDSIFRAGIRVTASVAFLLAALAHAADLPEGAGKDTVLKVCTVCHSVSEITDKQKTKKEWDETVDTMAERGAKASDEEFDAIVAYLTKYFGKDETPKDEPTQEKPSKK